MPDEDILDIKHRAGISTNWDRNAALRALATIDNAMVDLLDELHGIEDRERRDLLISMVQERGIDIVSIRNLLRRTQ